MEGLCPCGHEPTGSIVPVSQLVIVKSILKIIIHVLKLLRKKVECFTLKPHAHGTFLNVQIKINLNINSLENNRSIETKFCILSIFVAQNIQCPPLWCRRQRARLSRSGSRFDPRPEQVSWMRFFLTRKTNVRKFYALVVSRISFVHHNHPYHIRLVRMNE